MVFPHITAISQAVKFAPNVGAAASGVTNTFASLLQKAVGRAENPTSLKSSFNSSLSDPNGANVNLPALKQQTEALIQGLHSFVKQMLSENRIDLDSGIHLQLDDLGKIRVTGQHPDTPQIESLFATQPELADLLQVIAANSRLLKAADESKAFQQLYNLDPAAAVANRPHLFTHNAGSPTETFDLYLDALRNEATFRRPGN